MRVREDDGRRRWLMLSEPRATDLLRRALGFTKIVGTDSPVGRAILGAREGESRMYLFAGRVRRVYVESITRFDC